VHAATRALAILLAAFVAACASLPVSSPPSATVDTADTPFSIAGRISARHGDAGLAGGFTWVHAGPRDTIDLATPLGQTLARLQGDADGVTVHLQDGRVETARSWRELTERAFGVTIPVDGMSAWVRAMPRADSPYAIERDSQARVSLLRQDGWEIAYAYADDANRRPFRVVLTMPGGEPVDVRVVVDRWQ
jgi:outer membrane lipoprotein LolB